MHMNHEFRSDYHENSPGRLRRVISAVGGFATEKTLKARGRIASFISPELAKEAGLASVDPSTGLPNRRAMQRQYEDLVKSGDPFAVIMVDLDDFKLVNTQIGHENADDIIYQFAQCLSRCTRQTDEISYLGEAFRTGGDEFVLLAPLVPNPETEKYPNSNQDLNPEERLTALKTRLYQECFSGVDLKDADGHQVKITATFSAEIIDPHQDVESSLVLNSLSKIITSEKQNRRKI